MRRSMLVGLFLLSLAVAHMVVIPDSFPTIQAGIDGAANGDTVLALVNRYYENIDFHGKNVVVASQFLLEGQGVWILKTVIDGSQPLDPDTASCVRIVSGEDSTAQLVGFTITGGTGTRWQDEHGAGLFREGGGVLIQASSPVIRHNIITENSATDRTGCVSAGGGAIRVGDGNPLIVSNVIDNNAGRYGAGVVFNYSGGTMRNDIIAFNVGGEDYGGGGVWAYENGPAGKLTENCTFVGNRSAQVGGGVRYWSADGSFRNCIFWANHATNGAQVHPMSGAPVTTYCDIQGGRAGAGNIDTLPNWSLGDFLLHVPSPCVDAGDPNTVYDDPDSAGVARWPALGSLRNDMGAYGGPLAGDLNAGISGGIMDEASVGATRPSLRIWPQPAARMVNVAGPSAVRVIVSDVAGRGVLSGAMDARGELVLDVSRLRAGVYLCRAVGTRAATARIIVGR